MSQDIVKYEFVRNFYRYVNKLEKQAEILDCYVE